MSYKRSVLLDIGGFDETFPYAAGEDADLKWRICAAGHRLLYVPSRVIHLQPYTWAAFRKQQMTHGRGAVHFDRKYHQIPSRLRLILRVVKRGLLVAPDLLRIGPAIAWIKLWAGWYECWGQWLEANKLRAERKMTVGGHPYART
jgi:GT2 family glycosyltransferase